MTFRPGRSTALVVLWATLVGGCHGPVTHMTATGNTLAPTCGAAPAARPVTVDLINRVFAQVDLPTWQAADIGASSRLSDGRLVWVFGDTVRTAALAPRIVANSMLISSGTCIAQVLPQDRGPVIPDVAPKVVQWPMSVVRLAPTDEEHAHGVADVLLVLTGRTERYGTGAFAFRFLGTSATVFTVRPDQAPQLLSQRELTPDSRSTTQVDWGAAATASGGFLYLYGTRRPTPTFAFGHALYAARVPLDSPTDRTRWRFWDGTRWQPRIGGAAPVLAADGGVSQTLSSTTSRARGWPSPSAAATSVTTSTRGPLPAPWGRGRRGGACRHPPASTPATCSTHHSRTRRSHSSAASCSSASAATSPMSRSSYATPSSDGPSSPKSIAPDPRDPAPPWSSQTQAGRPDHRLARARPHPV